MTLLPYSNHILIPTNISYAYDPNGRRIEKDVDGVITRYIYNNEDIILELDGNNITKAYYVHGPGIDEPIAMQRNGQWYYYHADGLGSVVDLTDASGNMVNSYLYDSFGNIVDETEGVENFYTYTGRELDEESDLYYYRTRYYDASIGRFLSLDPARQSPNYYIYAKANPIKFTDPSGLVVEVCTRPVKGLFIFTHCFIKYGDKTSAFDTSGIHPETNPKGATCIQVSNSSKGSCDIKEREVADAIGRAQATGNWSADNYVLRTHNCCSYVKHLLNAASLRMPISPNGGAGL